MIELPPIKPEVGFSAPEFTLYTLDGVEVSKQSLLGRPVLINYWASWCIPCMEELPMLEQISKDYPEVTIVSINGIEQDNLEDVRAKVSELGLTHTILLDKGEAFWKNYLVLFLPTSFFLDSSGVIHSVQFGSLTREMIEQRLDQMIANQ